MFRMDWGYRQFQLHGNWDESCPFKFDYEFFLQKQRIEEQHTELQIKSVDNKIYASVEEEENLSIIKIQGEMKISIEIKRNQDEWNLEKMSFTSEYLCVLNSSLSEIYYYNFTQKQGNYYRFEKGLILSYLYSSKQLSLVVSEQQNSLSLYRIDQQLILQFQKYIDFKYILKEQSIRIQHRLGFFKRYDFIVSLISNQTLKPLCAFCKSQQESYEENLTHNPYQQQCFFLKDILFGIEWDLSTLMVHLQSGRIIRKIKHNDDAMFGQYSLQIFHHFLIICSQISKYVNVLEIYDFQKGRLVATVYYKAFEVLEPVTITGDHLIIPSGYGWRIKEQYQKK